MITLGCGSFALKGIRELPADFKIHFISDRAGNPEIYMMALDGSHQTRLTFTPASEYYSVGLLGWGQVVFLTDRDDNKEIYRMNVDGSDQRRLTFTTEDEDSPRRSPDGKWIVFGLYRGLN